MKVEEVMRCSFPVWYHDFKKVTFNSTIIHLPTEVVKYLLSDGLVLPEGSSQNYTCQPNSSDDSGSEIDWDAAADETPALQRPAFPEFDEKIRTAIKQLGGAVFIKLNWSAPKDATWISVSNSLKCTCPADIYLLLKSSDFILHDLSQPFKDCEDSSSATPASLDYCLVLRRWVDINPGTEFRCFVRKREVIAVCQRDSTNYYSYIHQQKTDIMQDILSLFYENIQSRFPSENYVFDTWRKCKDKVKLVDFNPYGQTTDGILFEWDELLTIGEICSPCAPDGVASLSGENLKKTGIAEDCDLTSSCAQHMDNPENHNRKNCAEHANQKGCVMCHASRTEDLCESACLPADSNQKTRATGIGQHSLKSSCKMPVFYFITSDAGVQPHPFRHYGVPRDVVELSTGQDALKFINLMKTKMRCQDTDSSEAEDDVSKQSADVTCGFPVTCEK